MRWVLRDSGSTTSALPTYWTEICFATGKAAVSGLRKFFDRLSAWIRDVYFKETMIDSGGTACKHCSLDHVASAESFLNRVENREWQEARQNVEILKSAHPEFSDREALGQAKLGALATTLLTRRGGVPVTQMERRSPIVSNIRVERALHETSVSPEQKLLHES